MQKFPGRREDIEESWMEITKGWAFILMLDMERGCPDPFPSKCDTEWRHEWSRVFNCTQGEVNLSIFLWSRALFFVTSFLPRDLILLASHFATLIVFLPWTSGFLHSLPLLFFSYKLVCLIHSPVALVSNFPLGNSLSLSISSCHLFLYFPRFSSFVFFPFRREAYQKRKWREKEIQKEDSRTCIGKKRAMKKREVKRN